MNNNKSRCKDINFYLTKKFFYKNSVNTNSNNNRVNIYSYNLKNNNVKKILTAVDFLYQN